MVTIMTALWFEHLRAEDRVSVKPHASPVLHAINYLLGELDERYLTTLRAFGGLQSYPSRAKDPDPVDYSTGSVGIGATAPIWGALARRYVDARFGADAGTGRQYSLVGDAELDEGACWEAILDPMVAELGEVVWIVDLNRQSLDRVVPNIGATRLQGMFAAAGWQVLTVKYGRLLEELFARPGGDGAAASASTTCPTRSTSGCCAAPPTQLRERLPGDGAGADAIARADRRRSTTTTLHAAIRNLGGHDLRRARRRLRRDRRHPAHGDLRLHRQGLRAGQPRGTRRTTPRCSPSEQIDELAAAARRRRRTTRGRGSPTGTPRPPAVRGGRGPAAPRAGRPRRPRRRCPADIGRTPSGTATTQAALGRALLDLTRAAPGGRRPGRHGQPGRQLHRPTSAAG